MKKGLRRPATVVPVVVRALMDSLMKKGLRRHAARLRWTPWALMDSLMKKGLRQQSAHRLQPRGGLDGFPDEEGIKTVFMASGPVGGVALMDSLMKKGLRLVSGIHRV